jgi:putative DNA primase/helicase
MDKVPVNRKNQKEVHATLPCRFVVSANKLPILPDSSGALRARILVLRFNQSFLGREDKQLGAKIAAELPGIFVWALDGLDRLRKRGSFVQPEIGKEELAVYEEIASPELSFIEECCEVGAGLRVPKDELFRAWQLWHQQNSQPLPTGGKGGLTQALTTHHPHIGETKMPRREDGSQQRAYSGITLNSYATARYGACGYDEDIRLSGW